ncbi:hypothetical protein ABES02_14925 [Neobacillus pocheonensis]|uniref:hypothetical protein n=1 Tax=Neobacillus pocheonensis TaxID=363869 RepID=UPI003D265A1D
MYDIGLANSAWYCSPFLWNGVFVAILFGFADKSLRFADKMQFFADKSFSFADKTQFSADKLLLYNLFEKE